MRKKGSITKAMCWRCDVVNQNETIYSNEYSTLKEIANDLGLSYSQIVEISAERKKQPTGRYDTSYKLTKIKNGVKLNNAEKLNEIEEEVKKDTDETENE